MLHKKIRFPRENAYEILRCLGSLDNAIEFVDLTKDDIESKKSFSSNIKRCDILLTKILEFKKICSNFHLNYDKYSLNEDFHNPMNEDIQNRDKVFRAEYLDSIESEILDIDRELKELIDSNTQMREDLINLIEKKHVLNKTSDLIKTDFLIGSKFDDVESNQEGFNSSIERRLNFLSGVCNCRDELRLKRMIFRVSRGRALCSFYDLNLMEDELVFITEAGERGFNLSKRHLGQQVERDTLPILDKKGRINKKIFNIIFQGEEHGVLLTKVMQVCDLFHVNRYGVPKGENIGIVVNNIENEIKEKKEVLVKIEMNIQDILRKAQKYSPTNKKTRYSLYYLFLQQEKLIYITLNKCLVRESFIDGEVWIPKSKEEKINTKLNTLFKGQENKITASLQDIDIPHGVSPPTYIQTNEFLWAFQEIVNIYGIPRYQEINPGFFNIITFPFLFGVMFGDICHGLIVFIFAVYLCLFSNHIQLNKGIMKSLVKARYFLLIMGFFALYCGWCYNDFLSIPIELMSCYKERYITGTGGYYSVKKNDCVYPIGIDPIWSLSSNELTFVNSLKMKLSVILGVMHMSFGIILKGANALFFREYREFFLMFIPQIIFMLLLFGYMDLLIVIKWVKPWSKHDIPDLPDIKSVLLDIFLSMGKVDFALWGDNTSMQIFHLIILVVVILCVIVMLIPKPILEYRAKCSKQGYRKLINNIEEDLSINNLQEYKEEIPAFSNFMVQSVIETIEFVLGAISNTASYLRLWALSLAHSQLSKVAFQYGIITPATFNINPYINGFLLSITYIIFACLTVFVLLLMDLMECFLHTLRLHWVEFQDKFFKADGYAFVPFCFKTIINIEE